MDGQFNNKGKYNMSHELTIQENGFVEMAFVGKTPWHCLGQSLDKNASIEQWQVSAGMNWTVEDFPVLYAVPVDGKLEHKCFDSKKVLYRSDTKEPLSVVSNRYKPVQPAECLEFFRDLVQESGFRIHTAGTLRGGKQLWALAETGRYGEVSKGDGVGAFLLLSTSCDRTLATTARSTKVRVVCNNTLSMAISVDDKHKVSFTHIQKFDHAEVKRRLGCSVKSFGAFLETAKFLQNQKITLNQAQLFLKNILGPYVQTKEDDFFVENNRAYKKILTLFNEEAKGIEFAGHTKWGLLNAVTEYCDHHNTSRNDDARLSSTWFGTGSKIKTNTFNMLLL